MIAELASMALAAGEGECDVSQFAAAACTGSGRIRVPYGTGRVLVAGLPGRVEPAGLLYLLPPVRLITAHHDRGQEARRCREGARTCRGIPRLPLLPSLPADCSRPCSRPAP
ncbi:hypothetical protein [Streptomyces sp. NPDC057052]|uniref:hypothetical protein n=1 Tax=Streptomyces sp. NPDC057052 TaxID=3346010 RepID=UPI00362A734C